MKDRNLAFVHIDDTDEGPRAALSVEGMLLLSRDPETTLREAAAVYARHLADMRRVLSQIECLRASRRPIPARKIWQLGNLVFRLRDALARHSLQLDDLYAHLTRDLGVKRKWLEKAIILRRYIPSSTMIPKGLTWGRCEKGTRRVAQDLAVRYRRSAQ